MSIKIVSFDPSHIDLMDMRDHEKQSFPDFDWQTLMQSSSESKTAMIGNDILCCWGMLENNCLWQVPSVHISNNRFSYAKQAIKVIRDLVAGKEDVKTICLDDRLHDRWMRFIGFTRNSEARYIINEKQFVLYELI